MALGPENFNLTVALNSVFCFQGQDIHDFFDDESEPYLWVIMVKIDAEGFHQDSSFLLGEAKFFFSPGSHGNIGGSIGTGQSRKIPPAVGTWETSLESIPLTVDIPVDLPPSVPIPVDGQQLTSLPGVILCGAVLLEENLTPNSAVEAAHNSVNNLVKSTVADTIMSMSLPGLAGDTAAEIIWETNQGNTITLAAAVQRALRRRLKPIQDLFTVAASGTAVMTILQNLDVGGSLGTAIDSDKPMGVFSQLFNQAELANTFESAAGLPSNYGRISIDRHLWHMPEWAYSLHGETYAHHKFDRKAAPASSRLQVTCTSKRRTMSGEKRVSGIGGVDGGSFWMLGRAEAAEMIRSGQKTFFVAGPGNQTVDVAAVQGGYSHGQPWYYLQTPADQIRANNLLDLPDCPAGGTEVEIWY